MAWEWECKLPLAHAVRRVIITKGLVTRRGLFHGIILVQSEMASYLVQFNSSSGGFYSVTVEWDELGIASLKCDCPAGRSSQLCKHLKAFFAADMSMLHRPDQAETYRHLCRMLGASPFAEGFRILQQNLRTAPTSTMEWGGPPTGEELKTQFVKTLAGV